MRSSIKYVASVTGAGSLALVAVLALSPLSAYAKDHVATKTALTVTGPEGNVVAYQAVTFVAKVSPFKKGKLAATGTVTFTITAPSSVTTPVNCTGTNAPAITKGTATCAVTAGTLVASTTPYSVMATYAGDTHFATSVDKTSITVGQVTTQLSVAAVATPTSGAAATFTATLVGDNVSLATGSVVFVISATTTSSKSTIDVCKGSDMQPVSAGVATCALAAGWFTLPAASKKVPDPTGTWSIQALYLGDTNFSTSQSNLLSSSSAG